MPPSGPIHTPSADVFDDFDDDQGHNLIGSLQLDAEDEPVRRGASRANSVRFDVSAIHGANWASTGSRSSGEFGPVVRPNSGLGSHPIERSSSHKSDGRHSSAGHSAHSGRTSSLGLDTNFLIGNQDDDESSIHMPEPPPGFFVLGSVPSIIRCWLSDDFSHGALLYAVVCSGSQKSTLEWSLVKELGLSAAIQKNNAGASILHIPVYLPEAVITHPSSRANSPAPQLPTLTAIFEVVGYNRAGFSKRKAIRVFIGSDTLRAHSADLLLSQNVMTLYGNDRKKLTIPFVRPEDETVFKEITTTNISPERIELKATAVEFKPFSETKGDPAVNEVVTTKALDTPNDNFESSADKSSHSVDMPSIDTRKATIDIGIMQSENGAVTDITSQYLTQDDHGRTIDGDKREANGIWGSWRSGGGGSSTDTEVNRDSIQRAVRGGRSMKVLKPSRVSSGNRSTSAARTGSSYEPAAPRSSGESRQKSGAGFTETNGTLRWESKRTPLDEKPVKEPKLVAGVSKATNPVGGASAFAWMNPVRSKSGMTAND